MILHYNNFWGLILWIIPTLNLFLCENFRTSGIQKYNNYRKNQIKYITEQMSSDDISRYLKARPLIKALIEDAKSDPNYNWETIQDELSDEAYMLLYPKYKQFHKEHKKKIKEIKKESLYEPYSGENFAELRVYVDRIIDKSRYVLLWLWIILFTTYLTGFNDCICSLFNQ